jgi:hypothetical protein
MVTTVVFQHSFTIPDSWFYCFFGTLAMAAGQLFGENLYPVMSNTGILIFIITIEAVMVEVDKDIVAIENEASFLVCVALKGDEISVARPGTVEQRIHDEETPTIISDQADTDGAEVAGGLDSPTDSAESNIQNDVVDVFQDEEASTSKGVDELNIQSDALDNNHSAESEKIGATGASPPSSTTVQRKYNKEMVVE